MAKVFKSVNSQIRILQSRGMRFRDIQYAKKVLKSKNYYNVINGMKKFLLDNSTPGTEAYKKNLCFEEVLALYDFDNGLRTLFLKNILIIEREFRTHIAYEFSKLESPDGWDNTSSFDYTTHRKQLYVNDLISTLNDNAIRSQRDSHDDMLNHFHATGTKIPIWALINTFDFGTLKRFYINAKENLRNEIAKYYNITASQVRSFLEALHMYRNVCAHDFRILFYRIYDINKRLPDMNVHSNLKIERNASNEYLRGKGDLFAIVIIFKYMLSETDFNYFFKDLKKLVKKIKCKIKTVSFDDILDSIGFPKKTDTQLSWNKIKTIDK